MQRIVLVSIVGTDRFAGGFLAAKHAHEQALLTGPVPVQILRARRSFTSSSRRWWNGARRAM